MKLAELKRKIVVGTKLRMLSHKHNGPLVGLVRAVKLVQTNAIQFEPHAEGKQGSWLFWPKAKNVAFSSADPNVFSIMDDDGSTFMSYEIVGDEPGDIPGDFRVENHGSIMLVHPLSEAADDWISEHVPEAMFHGDALIVEPHYIHSLVVGMEDDGLVRI